MASAGGRGEHAAPLGLYWTVDVEKKKRKQTNRVYEQEATTVQQASVTKNPKHTKCNTSELLHLEKKQTYHYSVQ